MKIKGYEVALSEADLDKKLGKELLVVEMISSQREEYKNLPEGDKKALQHLVNAAKIMNDVSLEQDYKLNLPIKKELEKKAQEDIYAQKVLRFFNTFNGVEGLNGVDKEPIEIFKGLHGNKGRNFYPDDLSIKEFHTVIKSMIEAGNIEEVQAILSSRTMVVRVGQELKAIDYTQYFAPYFIDVAKELRLAAQTATNVDFAEYLELQAQALEQHDENLDAKADKLWAQLQDTNLEFTLGRENYEDELTPTIFDNKELMKLIAEHKIDVNSKDMLGIRVGIINKKGTDLILKFKAHMCELAKIMPYNDRYDQPVSCSGELKQTMVDADLITLSGDYAACRGAITTAQNLPNNDKLSVKMGGGRRNVYHRQVRQSVDAERDKKLLNLLVNEELHNYYDLEADHLFVIGHENGHSLGPDSYYQNALGLYKHIIEEHKADVISIAFMPEYVKAGVIDEETLKKVYTTWVAYRLFMKAEPNFSLPHRIADLIQFNYLLENKAISFDDKGKLNIDFNSFNAVLSQLLKETIEVQLSKSPEVAKSFIDKYATWGEHSQRIAKVHQDLGLKPYKEIRTYF